MTTILVVTKYLGLRVSFMISYTMVLMFNRSYIIHVAAFNAMYLPVFIQNILEYHTYIHVCLSWILNSAKYGKY